MTAISEQRTHRAWCENHQYDREGGEIVGWGFCATVDVKVGTKAVYLDDGTPTGKPGIYVYEGSDADPLDLAEARELAAVILAMCELLRLAATASAEVDA